jgi:hypothetical protein
VEAGKSRGKLLLSPGYALARPDSQKWPSHWEQEWKEVR